MKRTTQLTNALACIALAGLSASLVSCAESKNTSMDDRLLPMPFSLARQAPRVYDSSKRPITKALDVRDTFRASLDRGPRLVERITLTDTSPRDLGAEGFTQTDPASRVVHVRYETEEADISEVLAVLLRDFLERDYVMDPKVNGLVNLSIDEEMTVEEIERLVAGLCHLYSLRMESEDGRYTIRMASAGSQGGKVPVSAPIYMAQPLLGNELPAIRLRKLRHMTGEAATKILKELMSDGSLVSSSGDMLVMEIGRAHV